MKFNDLTVGEIYPDKKQGTITFEYLCKKDTVQGEVKLSNEEVEEIFTKEEDGYPVFPECYNTYKINGDNIASSVFDFDTLEVKDAIKELLAESQRNNADAAELAAEYKKENKPTLENFTKKLDYKLTSFELEEYFLKRRRHEIVENIVFQYRVGIKTHYEVVHFDNLIKYLEVQEEGEGYLLEEAVEQLKKHCYDVAEALRFISWSDLEKALKWSGKMDGFSPLEQESFEVVKDFYKKDPKTAESFLIRRSDFYKTSDYDVLAAAAENDKYLTKVVNAMLTIAV